ncbi:DNA/RNA helicase domain-containing protein [Plastoroseomonas hellenica]|uniref:DNA/RNA helicase domain-containing protein n=1 Tax=Plastoroseomonas hellenica TaxID=2687306 RepID=UPI001BA9A08F|nr:DNA/RNA helicase domain-containing protein [Plastoroseomonas hellenica]MBR0647462.1 DUF2075 domain-containing protein [Plastoroseomonas hellenica]
MRAWLSLSVREFAAVPDATIAAHLAAAQARRHAAIEPAQMNAWEATAALLRRALVGAPEAWRILFEYDLLRLERRIDAVLLTDRAILVIEVKHRGTTHEAAALAQAEDYALDLFDFHAASRAHPILPVLVATAAAPRRFEPSLPLGFGVAPTVLRCNADDLGAMIRDALAALPPPTVPLDPDAWEGAAYRPVPTVLEAATMLYRRNSVAEIAEARADAPNLTRTTAAIGRAIAEARREHRHLIVFVTGIPGAGKTLCGLNVVFGALRQHGAAFLTGNVPLVAVLREALARNAASEGGRALSLQRDRARTALQNVHRFLEHHVLRPAEIPPERIIVFDEAQRAWDAAQATRDTQRRVSRLTASEPAHALEIMGRHLDGAVIVALIGNGQEINTGEAGLAEWGRVVASDTRWHAIAAPRVLTAETPAQRLAAGPAAWLTLDPDLDLTVPMRSIRSADGAPWVDAVLDGDRDRAVAIARDAEALPYLLTRDLDAARRGLRALARGTRRAGLVASAGAKRLRAEGLGVQTDNVADWFLRRWPDVRGSDALETIATEYDCQGLELDLVGLAWGGDLLRSGPGWSMRRFSGDRWLTVQNAAERDFIRNTYRVLLTRARYETILYIPRGDAADATRDPAEFEAIAAFLLACGARPLEPMPAAPPLPAAQAALL